MYIAMSSEVVKLLSYVLLQPICLEPNIYKYTISGFNSNHWIEIQKFQVSIQSAGLKLRMFWFQVKSLKWNYTSTNDLHKALSYIKWVYKLLDTCTHVWGVLKYNHMCLKPSKLMYTRQSSNIEAIQANLNEVQT